MKQAGTMEEAKAAIEAAGYTFDELRSFGPDELGRPGYAFSVESDRRNYGHPLMEVRVERLCLGCGRPLNQDGRGADCCSRACVRAYVVRESARRLQASGRS